ncbi:MAG TPA: hypothetical protein VM537_36295 [Anaerolineae bacterium]|nr:hypothetical protein [Anaerolineae bacterium]
MKIKERRSLELSGNEWKHLEALARTFDTCPPSGPTAGHPSWRSLIKEVSRGELEIISWNPDQGNIGQDRKVYPDQRSWRDGVPEMAAPKEADDD